MDSGKKPGVAFWATVVVVVVLVAYPLSFGPACWITSHMQPSGRFASAAYRPILLAWLNGPDWFGAALASYVRLGARGIFSVSGDEPPVIEFYHPPT